MYSSPSVLRLLVSEDFTLVDQIGTGPFLRDELIFLLVLTVRADNFDE